MHLIQVRAAYERLGAIAASVMVSTVLNRQRWLTLPLEASSSVFALLDKLELQILLICTLARGIGHTVLGEPKHLAFPRIPYDGRPWQQ